MIAEVTLSPMGLGWESAGIHPRSENWVLNGFGHDRDSALADYQNRYRQEHYVGLYDPPEYETEVVEVNVTPPAWYVSEPEPEETEPENPDGPKVDLGDL